MGPLRGAYFHCEGSTLINGISALEERSRAPPTMWVTERRQPWTRTRALTGGQPSGYLNLIFPRLHTCRNYISAYEPPCQAVPGTAPPTDWDGTLGNPARAPSGHRGIVHFDPKHAGSWELLGDISIWLLRSETRVRHTNAPYSAGQSPPDNHMTVLCWGDSSVLCKSLLPHPAVFIPQACSPLPCSHCPRKPPRLERYFQF